MADPSLQDVVHSAEELAPDDRFDALHDLRTHPELADDTLRALEPQTAFRAARLLAASGDPSDLPAVARLSLRAHEGEIEGAGLIHAEASDKIALYTGRPQLYGTVMLEHQGDIVQPPVDKRVSDDERAALGVPSLGELQRRMHELGRRLARERAATPGVLPEGQRFCRVWPERTPQQLRDRWQAEGTSAWIDGDVITFITESDSPVTVQPVFPIETWDAGDGLQVLSVRVERAEEAVVTYTFTPTDGPASFNFSRGSHDGRVRGPDAPPELTSNDPLLGSSSQHVIESDALGAGRKVTVYLPAHTEAADLPVIYATDGNMFSPYARRLDAAIEQGLCPPVIVVAAHSAGFDPMLGNRRAAEYLPGFDEQAYTAHQKFFVHELADWAQSEVGVSADRARRAVWGCSDGGGHAAMVARLFPDRFGHAFVYSTGMAPDLQVPWTADHPVMQLCAGTLEGPFHQATEAWAGYLMLAGVPYHFTERVAGHDLVQWAEELPNAIRRAWG